MKQSVRNLSILCVLLASLFAPATWAAACTDVYAEPDGINENLQASGNTLDLSGVPFADNPWPASGTTLASGDYYYRGDSLGNGYRLDVEDGAEVRIFVNGSLSTGNNADFNANRNNDQLLLVARGSFSAGNNTEIRGLVYAGGTISLGNNADIRGGLAAGGNIAIGNRSPVVDYSGVDAGLLDGLCDSGASGPVDLSANGNTEGPVGVGVGENVLFSGAVSGCPPVPGFSTQEWRETWRVNGNQVLQSTFGTSSCERAPLERTQVFDTAGLYDVGLLVEYRNCLFGFFCGNWQLHGEDDITIDVNDDDALTCFLDDYAAGSLNPDDWVTSVSLGNFTPQIVGGRLRMTEAQGNQATAATLQREIPGAENLVVLEFNYYAYGGNGADGLAIALSDALVTPQPGSYGGSLGYAQRNNGDPGFAGGWIGIGLDEFGNFSNSNEGRVGGGNGRTLDSVAIRGAAPDYRFMRATDRLNPGIDTPNTNNPDPQRYRIIIDSRQAGEAIVSVERDLTATGNNYDTLIAPFNALNETGQPAVPENFLLSLTGSTGGSTNIHELDEFQLCALKLNPVGEQVDHFEIIHDGLALTCQPETVSVRACANGDCSELFTDPVDATLSTTAGTWQGGNVVSLINGLGEATLQNTTAGDAELDVVGSQPSARPQSVTLCENGTGSLSVANCTLPFADAGLAFTVPDMISHRTAENVQVRAVQKDPQTEACVPAFENVDREVAFHSGYVEPNANGRPVSRPLSIDGADVSGSASSPTPITLSFGAGGIAEIDVRYPDAGQLLLNARYEGSAANQDQGLVLEGSDDDFEVRPAGLCVTTAGACAAADITCPTFARADEEFDLSIQAVGWQSDSDTNFCAGNPSTPNFAMQGIGLSSEVVRPAAGRDGEVDPETYSHTPAANGINVVPAKVSEVGVFRFTARPTPGGYYGMTIPPATSAPAGRFYPDRFEVLVDEGEFTAECLRPETDPEYQSFTYFGQAFDWSAMPPRLEITPLSVEGGTTFNYADPDFTDPGDRAFRRLSSSGVLRAAEPVSDEAAVDVNGDALAIDVDQGVASLSVIAPGLLEYRYNAGDTVSYVKSVDARVAPVTDPAILFRVESIVDADGVSGAGAGYDIAPSFEDGFHIRYGRLEMDNVYGPENLTGSLPMPFRLQYWDGSRFTLNEADNCTSWTTGDIGGTSDYHTLQSDSGTFDDGEAGPLQLSPNGSTGANPTDRLVWGVPVWLQDDYDGDGTLQNPVGLATFGVYRGNDRVIYWQEQ